jgi:CheY-like chemotaxis protein
LLAALLAHARRMDALEAIRHNVTSDLREAEIQLLRAAQDKEKRLAMLAHELRNPLTPLHNGVEIVRQMSSGNPALARTTEMMSRQVMQLIRLVDDLVGTESAPPGQAAAAIPPGPHASARLRILVADDNADGADSLAMLLQAEGHVVLTAPDGHRAIEVAEAFSPDVILMDVAMPNLDGLEATREIRRRPWGQRIRIIALTAWGQESERQRTREAGMDEHLVKPVDPQTLAGALGKNFLSSS